MKPFLKKLIVIAMLLVGVSGFVLSCSKEEGPMEKAGKKVDQAVEKAGDKIEKSTD